MKKRVLILVLALVTLFTITSCAKKFTVTFNVDGKVVSTATVKKNKTVSQPTNPTKEGFVFEGWFVGNNKYDFGSKVTGDLSISARFKESGSVQPNEKVTITFETNGGSEVPPMEIAKGSVPTRPANPTKAGLVFDGWTEKGKDSEYTFKSKLQRDIVLVANWRDFARVSFKLNLGKIDEATAELFPDLSEDQLALMNSTEQEVTYGESLSVLPNAIRDKFTFAGWTVNGVDFDGSQAITEDTVLVAKWNQIEGLNYVTVSFDTNGGDNTIEPIVLAQGGVLTNLAELDPGKKPGFTHESWKIGSETGDNVGPTTSISQTCTIVAVWSDDNAQQVEYSPKWELNQQTGNWNGKGMDVKILVLPAYSFDPFNVGYSQADKKIKQKHQRLVEAAYGVSIVYEEWGNSASWGPNRIAYIKQMSTGEFRKQDIYILNITASWIPTLVKEDCLAELYDLTTEEGIFTEIGYQETSEGSGVFKPLGYEQNETINQVCSTAGKVYGYVDGSVEPDYFMYFNATLIEESGLENPAELWFKGEWTWDKFEKYSEDLQKYLNGNKNTETDKYYALALGYPEFFIGSCGSTGSKIASASPAAVNLTTPNVIARLNAIQKLVTGGGYDKTRGSADVAPSFAQGKVGFHHGDLWFLNDPSRFDPTWTFEIGCVPYPTANNEGGVPITTTDPEKAIKKADGNPLTDATGQYISGVDMSGSSFKVPYTTTSCFSIADTPSGKNGINNKIIFAIMYDLFSGLGENPNAAKVSKEVAYRNFLITKFDSEIYADVIMSVKDCTYFELIDIVSMSVGGGSQFGPNALWVTLPNVCLGKADANSTLTEIDSIYKDKMEDMGYIIAR